jgi:hypothetical protein
MNSGPACARDRWSHALATATKKHHTDENSRCRPERLRDPLTCYLSGSSITAIPNTSCGWTPASPYLTISGTVVECCVEAEVPVIVIV